jgi:hypothetical protein
MRDGEARVRTDLHWVDMAGCSFCNARGERVAVACQLGSNHSL